MDRISGSSSMGYQPVLQYESLPRTSSAVPDTSSDDRSNPFFDPPILAACSTGNIRWLRELLSGDDGQLDYGLAFNLLNQPYPSGYNGEPVYPLYVAAQHGKLELVKEFAAIMEKAVASMADSEKFDTVLSALCAPSTNGSTPLFIAAENGHLDVVEYITGAVMKILENMPEGDDKLRTILSVVNVARKDGITALCIAAKMGCLDVVEFITSVVMKTVEQLEDGKLRKTLLVLNDNCKNRGTPLYAAAYSGHSDIARYITSVMMTVLEKLEGDEKLRETLRMLNTPCNGGVTAFFVAAENGHIDIVKYISSFALEAMENLPDDDKLGELMAVVNTPRKDGVTPFYMAATNGHFAVVKHIIEITEKLSESAKLGLLNADLDNNDTPLRIASRNGHYAIVNLLLHKGADPKKGLRISSLGKYPVFKAFLTQSPKEAALIGGHRNIADRIATAVRERKASATSLAMTPSTSALTAESAL